jgi:muconate cycloisomerase
VATVSDLDVLAVDLPLRVPFDHAAAHRERSESVFVRVELDDGTEGWGESLPRPYVTGETVDGAVELLREAIRPALIGERFGGVGEVVAFLTACDGAAPTSWVPATTPQAAAWCAVDLALLDAFARAEHRSVCEALTGSPVMIGARSTVRYSGVAADERGRRAWWKLARMRLYGLGAVKLKVGDDAIRATRTARRVLGARTDIRLDANMAWSPSDAIALADALIHLGADWFEQPFAPDDLDSPARLIEHTNARVVADESFTTRASLQALIARRACTGVNVRISKCGGLIAAYRRSREAVTAALDLQIGCHVGESSLLSSAQLCLLDALAAHQCPVRYAEGCYGLRLLAADPATPKLQFRFGGRQPARPAGIGFGVALDPAVLARYAKTTVPVS